MIPSCVGCLSGIIYLIVDNALLLLGVVGLIWFCLCDCKSLGQPANAGFVDGLIFLFARRSSSRIGLFKHHQLSVSKLLLQYLFYGA